MTKIKICGLKTIEDIQAMNRWKPDFAGFVFASGKRQITPGQAAELRRALDPKIQAVGVFVNAPLKEAAVLAETGVIQYIQLHGDEDAAYMEALRKQTDKPLVKAVAARSREEILEAEKPWFLAGGLSPGNVEQAIKTCRPFGVDVSSGVEIQGKKSQQRIREFIEKVRG